jgi:hypothetical protein
VGEEGVSETGEEEEGREGGREKTQETVNQET